MCCCARCSASPPSYVDHVLQETFKYSSNPSWDLNICYDAEVEKATDIIEGAISEYLLMNDPKSCCQKLENFLTRGLIAKEALLEQRLMLHPLHSLSLKAYVALASAYKTCADQEEDELCAFSTNRICTGYSLLLAGATHSLFQSDFSFVASAANFWAGAGESLINLSGKSSWNLFMKNPVVSGKCCPRCTLMNRFKASDGKFQSAELEILSTEFLECVTSLTPKVWSFLARGGSYLCEIEDPVDLNWLDTKRFSGSSDHSDMNGRISRCSGDYEQKRHGILQLGAHCLLYGGILSSIVSGQDSSVTRSVRRLLYGE